jgi:hypothetical protein
VFRFLLASNQMRRGFSIFLIMFFGFGPLSVFIDSEDANLPSCCRRHGAHHCAMSTRMAAVMRDAASGEMRTVSAPLTCPEYPGMAALLAAPAPALTVAAAGLPVPREQTRVAHARNATPEATPAPTHAGRGPPAAALS